MAQYNTASEIYKPGRRVRYTVTLFGETHTFTGVIADVNIALAGSMMPYYRVVGSDRLHWHENVVPIEED